MTGASEINCIDPAKIKIFEIQRQNDVVKFGFNLQTFHSDKCIDFFFNTAATRSE